MSAVRSRVTRPRAIAAAGVVVLLGVGMVAGGGSPEPSPETTVQQFLLAWEDGHYTAAAALTTGNPAAVAAELAAAYRQLDAADLVLSMGQISQRADQATASFDASFDLGRGGLPWNYQGHFALRRAGADWKVMWSPSVIAPGLQPGDRLAVLTTVPRRAQLLDAAGRPLAQPSLVYVAGVRPGRVRHPRATADGLARAIGLDAAVAGQVLGQILAAPSTAFLELVTLQPASYHRLSGKLAKIPGLIVRKSRIRLFDSIAPAISGSVGTETAPVLRENGVPYRPGTTVGMSGLQAAFQDRLAGSPTTEVVVQNAAGKRVSVLRQWPGQRGTSVRTTIDAATQRAADGVLAAAAEPAAIVAVRAGSGQILAVAQHAAPARPQISALAGRYRPGQSFTIISTAALLATGFSPATPTPCNPAEPDVGARALFSTDFAQACGTAFAGLSLNLNAADLTNAAERFGIGARWQLPAELGAFTGAMPLTSSVAQRAADSMGIGTVRVSPLDMALAAGVVQSGSWHPPSLVTSPADPTLAPHTAFGPQVVSQLRSLMRAAVRTGAGKAANVARTATYGQVGSAPLGRGGQGLRGNWFVGFNQDVAFAVLVFAKSPDNSAALLAGQFVRALRSGS